MARNRVARKNPVKRNSKNGKVIEVVDVMTLSWAMPTNHSTDSDPDREEKEKSSEHQADRRYKLQNAFEVSTINVQK